MYFALSIDVNDGPVNIGLPTERSLNQSVAIKTLNNIIMTSFSNSSVVSRRDSMQESIWSNMGTVKGTTQKIASSILTKVEMIPTTNYCEQMRKERPTAVFCYIIFLFLSPLVFRYAFASYISDTRELLKFVQTGNSTISTTIRWAECKSCTDVVGITLSNLTVRVEDVTSPAVDGPLPSIAIFASADLKNWSI